MVKKLAKWFLVRLPIAFIILGVIFAITLKMVERYPDPLKEGLQEYLSQTTQTNATITTVNHIKFFPDFDIDLADITFHEHENAALTNLSIDRIAIKLPFWSSIVGARRLDELFVENLSANSETILPHKLVIEKAEIIDRDGPEQFGSFIVAKGQYRGKKSIVEMKIKKMKKGYKIPNILSLSLKVGVYSLNTEVAKSFSAVKLENAVFQKGDIISDAASYSFSDKGGRNAENPLSCIIDAEKIEECDIYLENNKEE